MLFPLLLCLLENFQKSPVLWFRFYKTLVALKNLQHLKLLIGKFWNQFLDNAVFVIAYWSIIFIVEKVLFLWVITYQTYFLSQNWRMCTFGCNKEDRHLLRSKYEMHKNDKTHLFQRHHTFAPTVLKNLVGLKLHWKSLLT